MRSGGVLRIAREHPSLAIGGILTIGIFVTLIPHSQKAAPVPTPVIKHIIPTVWVASHALSVGTIVGATDIEAKLSPSSVPSGAVLSEKDALGRVLMRTYPANQTILREDLRDASTLGITARVVPGQRAFSIRVGEDDIVGGFLQSGDHVDAFATIPGSVFPSKNSIDVADRSRAVLLLQDVLVLAVGENPATHGSVQSEARTVTLSLTPDALAKLVLAQRYGKVSLAVRVPGDTSQQKDVTAGLADLVGREAPTTDRQSRGPKHRAASGIIFLSGTHTSALSWGVSR